MTTVLAHKGSIPIRLWWASIRPFSLGTSLFPFLFGTSLAIKEGFPLRIGVLFLTLLIAVLTHVATNLTNSLYDWVSGHDQPASPQAVPILRDCPHGELLVRRALTILALCTACIAVLFAYYTSWPMIIWPIVGYLGGIYYTKPPIAYKHKGLSLPGVFLLMGMILPMVSFGAQTAFVNWRLALLFLPLALLVTAILAANELRDCLDDATAGSITFTVRCGERCGTALFGLLITLPYLCIPISVVWLSLPASTLLVYLTLPLVTALTTSLTRQEFSGLDLLTARLHGGFCLIYTISLFL